MIKELIGLVGYEEGGFCGLNLYFSTNKPLFYFSDRIHVSFYSNKVAKIIIVTRGQCFQISFTNQTAAMRDSCAQNVFQQHTADFFAQILNFRFTIVQFKV